MKFYAAIALFGLASGIKLEGNPFTSYIYNGKTLPDQPVWGLRSVNVHQGMIAD